ncbi:putative ankyrin repeat protein [Chloropicon roscoffensis]|uniref:Ankyrin repeat protein n=1 Tax=Chloropicon roscoffensis TaxID=1461544 RepID=A0AAX4P387_9CHLO
MASGAGEPSTKRAKADEADEEEDPLVRRKEEVVRLLERARAKGKGTARAKEELLTLCADFEAKNEKLLERLLPELWEKIIDECLDQNDLFAFAMTCRFFREKQKDLGKKVDTNMNAFHLLELRRSGKVVSQSLGWFQWVCDTFEIQPGFERRSWERIKGAVYEGNLVNYAAFQGSVEILRWLMEENGWEPVGGLVCGRPGTSWWAGMGGSVEILEFLKLKGYGFNEWACTGAARAGRLEALKFLRGLDPPCPWDGEIGYWAASQGHLEVLKWARDQDPPCPWNEETCYQAAYGGHLDVLMWARSQNPPCPWDEETCALAADGGHLEVLKWARSQDPPCPWDEGTCLFAAQGGHLEVLKWARSEDPPCPWMRHICQEEARKSGHQHVIDWIDQREDESDVEFSDLEYSDSD